MGRVGISDLYQGLLRLKRAGGVQYRGTLPIRKRPPPWDPPWTLGIGLR